MDIGKRKEKESLGFWEKIWKKLVDPDLLE